MSKKKSERKKVRKKKRNEVTQTVAKARKPVSAGMSRGPWPSKILATPAVMKDKGEQETETRVGAVFTSRPGTKAATMACNLSGGFVRGRSRV
jgi:hypothetical protein